MEKGLRDRQMLIGQIQRDILEQIQTDIEPYTDPEVMTEGLEL